MIVVSRKMKETGSSIRSNKNGDIGHLTLDDYHPIDRLPSSTASIKPGHIEHGTPLMPFIPKPSPPGHPKLGDSTSPALLLQHASGYAPNLRNMSLHMGQVV